MVQHCGSSRESTSHADYIVKEKIIFCQYKEPCIKMLYNSVAYDFGEKMYLVSKYVIFLFVQFLPTSDLDP